VNRGGSWNNNPQNCRVSNRNNNTPDNRNNNLGLRLASQLNKPKSDDNVLNRRCPGPGFSGKSKGQNAAQYSIMAERGHFSLRYKMERLPINYTADWKL
jgi:hypothetical protein